MENLIKAGTKIGTPILLRVTLSERGWVAVKDGVPSQATKSDVLKVNPDKQASQDGIVFRCLLI